VQQLLSSHGGSTPDGENRYGCGAERRARRLVRHVPDASYVH
jgi:hypothetical protein